jgi:parallel beta-helix repeat protein
MKHLFTILFVFFLCSAQAATYYFSSVSGDDSRTSAQAKSASTPWRSLDKLYAYFTSLRSGDSVLLKRGETFYGSISIRTSGVKGSPIVIGAYGTGDKPVITGLTALSNWEAVGNGIYESYNPSLGTNLNMLLLNDAHQPIGRYPNKGYLKLESHVGKTSITDNELTSTPNWTGAELVTRPQRWLLNRAKITSHSGTTLYYSGTSEPKNNFGYFIQNSIKTLDLLGEWYYDPNTKKVSMYFGANSPSSYNIKASAINYLIFGGDKSYIVFDNLTFKGANAHAVAIHGGSNINVKNCNILFSGINGVYASGNAYFILENSTILNSNNDGINAGGSTTYAIIRNNYIKNSYYIAGMGQSGDGMGAGIRIKKNGLVEYNKIINSGFIGIQFNSDSVVLKNNYIDSFCFIKDDAGAIYTTNVSNVNLSSRKVIGNIVLNGIGAGAGTDITSSRAEGIYMDENSNGVEITGNTTANCNRGIYMHGTKNIVIKNNTCFNNIDGQLNMTYDGLGTPFRNHTITHNIFFAKVAKQMASSINTKYNDIESIGRFDSNYYARPIDDRSVISNITYLYSSSEYRRVFDIAGWRSVYNKDISSKSSAKKIAPYTLDSLTSLNKISTGAFSSSNDVSNVWSNYCTLSWGNSGVLDGGYLKSVPTAKRSSVVLRVGALSSQKKYILRYSLIGTAPMSISAYLRSSDNNSISAITYRPVSTTRRENEMLFTPSLNQTNGSLVFNVDAQSTYYLDNIQLYEADASVTNPDDSIRFVYNANRVSKTVSLNGDYVDVKNNKFSNAITLQPYKSAVLISNRRVQNTPPTVKITSPATAATFAAPASVTITAAAADTDGTVSKVEFYNGTTLLGTDAESPYTFTWNNVAAGNYTVTAKATDNGSLETTSAPVTFSVYNPNVPPTVSLTTPEDNSSYTAPATINMLATATDVDGTISKVQFYNDTTLLATEYQGTYSYSWTNVPEGTYTITAKATDNEGAVTTSSKVTVSVVAPSVSLISSNKPSNFINNSGTPVSSGVNLFPNPAGNTVFVSGKGLPQNKDFIISVVSKSGAILKTIRSNTSNKAVEVNVSSLSAGVYTIKATAGFITINKQFVKQ